MTAPRSANAGRDWDADVYDRVADPQEAWGREVLDRLPLEGDENLLDAGCGSGRVTELLLERLPHGRVIGVDASATMIAAARKRLGERAELRTGDLAELEVEVPVDAVFSNAVFHWIPDHDRLFARLHAALRPGGRLAAQCGARGNAASVREAARRAYDQPAFARARRPPTSTWNFATPEETAERLHAAGFTEIETWTAERPVTAADPRTFLSTVILGPHLARMPEELHASFVDAVLEQLGEPAVFDYVRLNIAARRPE
ncbi:MAG: methyltransferase domain-containing protein [Thermoleophilaceae bacterium]|nr:methyltransferase domain-containing protein [Thermoleophilaceae bacterium]